MVDIGKRYKADELVESVLKPSAKIAQGFETYRFDLTDGRVFTGLRRQRAGRRHRHPRSDGRSARVASQEIETRTILKQSMMPDGVVNNLTPDRAGRPDRVSTVARVAKSMTLPRL